jgi:glutathione S-transferase
MMTLFRTPASPFVRKVVVTILELGIADRVAEIQTRWPHRWATETVPFAPDFAAATPVGRIPALVTEEGMRLTDSQVICEYLNAEYGAHRLLPPEGPARWRMMEAVAIANACLEAQILRRAETLRHPPERSEAFIAKMQARGLRCFAALDGMIDRFGPEPDLARIATACACGFVDWRYGHDAWRDAAPRLGAWYEGFRERPSMRATEPAETPQ